MKTIFLLAALGIATTALSQNYPNNYGNNMPPPQQYPNYGNSQNGYYGNNQNGYGNNPNGYYGNNQNGYGNNPYGNNQYGNNYNNYSFYDDDFYNYANNNFPNYYYYNFPTDYYSTAYYNNFYNDYRRSIIGINWNNFFVEFNLNPIQIQQINIINRRFMNYNAWFSYYGMNPNRWYYDRYYMLQRVMGPSIYVVFQNRYYDGMNPMVYFQNYNISYYRSHYSCMPKYRNVTINNYYVKKDRFFVDNPRYSGFRNGANSGTTSNNGSGSLRNNFWALSSENGLRNNAGNLQTGTSGKTGFRNNSTTTGDISANPNGVKNGGFRNNSITPNEVQTNNGGFRHNNITPSEVQTNNGGIRNGGFRNNSTQTATVSSPSELGNIPTRDRNNSGFRGESQAAPRIERDNSSFRTESSPVRNAPTMERASGGGFRGGNEGGSISNRGGGSTGNNGSSGRSGGFR